MPSRVLNSIFYLFLLFFIACDPGEEPVPAHEGGMLKTISIDLGKDRDLQTFFDLGTESFVKTHDKYSWDFSLSCLEGVNEIYLNSSLFMKAQVLPQGFNHKPTIPDLDDLRADHHEWIPDSMSLGGLINSGQIAGVDMGTNADGSKRGFKKIEVNYNESTETYTIRYSSLNGKKRDSISIKKDPLYNSIEFSLATNSIVYATPPKDAYDFYLGQYTYQFYEPFTEYLVVGVILNPTMTVAALDESRDFGQITRGDIDSYQFSSRRDAIGHEWKAYNIDEGFYRIFPNINYIIKDHEGIYYKIHFLDYYNEQAVSGSPKFEVQRL